MTRPAFLDYDPVPIQFGTSGMRGLVRDLTDLEVYICVSGTLRYLFTAGDAAAGGMVAVGGDLRPSTERLLGAAAQAVADCGCTVEYAGRLPTPALVLHGIQTGRAAVMVTGSHIPFDRNGIKISKPTGELLKSDEPGILREIERGRAAEYAHTAASSRFDAHGMLRHAPALPPLDPSAAERYLARYVDAFGAGALAGVRVAFWEHSAVGRELVPRILGALGAVVIPVGRSDAFVPVDTENVSDADVQRLEQLAAAAGQVDAVVSTDGDSDRPLVAAIRPDGSALFLPGDLLGLVVAGWLGAERAAVPVSANDAVALELHKRGVELELTRIGSPYVVAALNAARDRRVVGWEANGGFLVGSDFGKLAALPTRDAVLPIVANLAMARAEGVRLEELWARLPPRAGRSGLIDTAAGPALMAKLVPAGTATEMRLAADSPEPWRRTRALLEEFFTSPLGFGAVVALNVLDGVRITFGNGDVAHLRPSGNAPQLRVYATADTPARAAEIVALCVREPDGILRRLEAALG